MSEISELIEQEVQDRVCPDCGAHFNIHAPRCPYCGNVNEFGDEEEYLRDLDVIREKLERAKNIPQESLKKEVAFQGKRVLKVFVTILVVAGIIAGIIALVTNRMMKKDEEMTILQHSWQLETFPKLNAMYDSGDYDGIVKFVDDMYRMNEEEKTSYTIWNWDHYEWFMAYDKYIGARAYFEDKTAKDRYSEESKVFVFYDCMYLLLEKWDVKNEVVKSLTDEDYLKVLSYQDEIRAFMIDHYGITNEYIDELAKEVAFDPPGVGVDYNKCKEVYPKKLANKE